MTVQSDVLNVLAPTDLLDRLSAAVAPEGELFADPDPALIGRSITESVLGAAKHPIKSAAATLRFAGALAEAGFGAARQALGQSLGVRADPDPKDRRFADPTWTQNPGFAALRQAYLASCDYVLDLMRIADLGPVEAGKAEIGLTFLLDALAPTNFLWTNPAALKLAFETGGGSARAGLLNMLDDLRYNNGRPRQVDSSPFEVGRNMACTPAKVVYRNRLIEVLQYLPQTDEVHGVPILCSPPWINKYYVMDLAPGRSFIEWAVTSQRTVFTISYRNPDESMADMSMDDYLTEGPLAALEVVRDITGSETVDIVGLCAGGSLTMLAAAYLGGLGQRIIGSITVINTLIDFSEPGILGRFTDLATVEAVEKKMKSKGYLHGSHMAGTFDMLRANELIFNYVASNWLMGKQPPAFDILAWNADST